MDPFGISKILDSLSSTLGGLFSTPKDKLALQQAIYKSKLDIMALQQQSAERQNSTNKIEASHTSLFVSGWRPFVGWSATILFLSLSVYNSIGVDVLTAYGIHATYANTNEVIAVLMGMLGLDRAFWLGHAPLSTPTKLPKPNIF